MVRSFETLSCGTWAQSTPPGRDLTSLSTLTDTRPPCFEVEKHALKLGASAHYQASDEPGALPHENGFPLHNVRARGQADPYMQRKCDGA
jgi:hypothetical protein